MTSIVQHQPFRRQLALMRQSARRIWLLVFALAISAGPGSLAAQEAPPEQIGPGQAATLSYGGRLYDNHWVVLKLPPPAQATPAYPADPGNALKSTWRCVSCHGWNYSGGGGIGQTGSKFVSLAPVKGRNPADISRLLKSGSHANIVSRMPDEALHALSLFLCCGQHDIGALVGPNGEAKGDPLRGKDIYDGVCNRCHQADGKAPIYGEPGDISSLGWVARHHPAQAAHKIRNGVPSADMVSLRFLTIAQIADLLAYLQTLDAQ